jgi:guanylate kinase
MLVILSGSSGIGKNTIINEIIKRYDGFELLPTFTTRGMRENESQGNPYYFVSVEEFLRRKENNEFLESENVHGNYYATSRLVLEEKKADKILIKDIDVKGALNLKERLGDVIIIFLKASSFDQLKSRLKGRKETRIEERLSRYNLELELSKKFDYVIINDDMDITINKIINLIKNIREQK